MLAGTAVSAIIGYFCVKYLIQFVAKHSLVGFAYYCWAVGAIMLFVLCFKPAAVAG
jgi:undecaprenyl-diphosphatase